MPDASLDATTQADLVRAAARERLLLRVASQLEEALPWGDRRPDVHA